MKRYTGTLTQNTTITASLNNDQDLELLLTQGGAGSFTVTWANVNTWLTPTGNPPVLQTAAGKSDLIQLSMTGGNIYGIHTAETGPTGAAGAAGTAGMTWRRLWVNSTAYNQNDAVYWNGSSYIALQPNTGQQPDQQPTFWSALASGGGTPTVAEYVDNFTRANNANISTNAPWTYALPTGTSLEILSNACHDADHSGGNNRARAGQTVTSADHHCQVTLSLFTNVATAQLQAGPCVRYSASADTCYMAITEPNGSAVRISIFSTVAGASSRIASGSNLASTPVAGDTIKLTVAGSTVTAYYNTVQQCTVTDTSITTGTQCGLHLHSVASTDVGLSELRFGL